MSRREIRSRSEFAVWWACVVFCVFMVGFGFFLLATYGINSIGGLVGLGFNIWGGWMFAQALELRRYVWHGDLR